MSEYFDADYYCNGLATGKSNYCDYKWLPDKTLPMVQSIKKYLDMETCSTVLDFGCSRGYMVKALRQIGMDAYGVDTSEWAIANCDPEVRGYVSTVFNGNVFDYIISKDTLEHIPFRELPNTVRYLLGQASISLFIVVPLTWHDGEDYICNRDEADPSHQIRWNLPTWLQFLQDMDGGFTINGSYHIPGVKDASMPFPQSCGFLTCKRI